MKPYPEPALLNDPGYQPRHPPRNGLVPAVVDRFGPRTQVRWFRRFRRALKDCQPWERWHTDSLLHTGLCCWRCQEPGPDYWHEPGCCCRGLDATDTQNGTP